MLTVPMLKHAARFSYSPVFSVFHQNSMCEYELLLKTGSANEAADRYREEIIKPQTFALEVRVDGVRLKF